MDTHQKRILDSIHRHLEEQMSQRERERRRRAADKLPPANRIPTPLADHDFVPVLEYHVGSWCPTSDGSGPAIAVALRMQGPILETGQTVTMHLRLKSARAVDELIAALERHRNDVWPGGS